MKKPVMTFEERIATLDRFPFYKMRDNVLKLLLGYGFKTPLDYYIAIAKKEGWYAEMEFWDFNNLPDDMQGLFESELHNRKEARDSKQKARVFTAKMVKDGVIKQECCEICDDPNTQSHHIPDESGTYNPFKIKWLCPEHHMMEHRILSSKRDKYRPNVPKMTEQDYAFVRNFFQEIVIADPDYSDSGHLETSPGAEHCTR